jgi:hypothetical protein
MVSATVSAQTVTRPPAAQAGAPEGIELDVIDEGIAHLN